MKFFIGGFFVSYNNELSIHKIYLSVFYICKYWNVVSYNKCKLG
nr:hypothetical protein BAR15_120071 [Bartonella sp. AR 15-3]